MGNSHGMAPSVGNGPGMHSRRYRHTALANIGSRIFTASGGGHTVNASGGGHTVIKDTFWGFLTIMTSFLGVLDYYDEFWGVLDYYDEFGRDS